MYYVETRADYSGYANHRVICLVVIGSSFDSEQVFHVSNDTFYSFWEMDSNKKNLADNSGYTNHRVTCLFVMGSPFDSEQVCWVSFQCLS
jgi:hypothetical protein